MAPHELLEYYIIDRLGQKVLAYLGLYEELFQPLVLGLTDQFSVYRDCRPYARLRVHEVRLREGRERSYIMIRVTASGGPLRMQNIMDIYRPEPGDRIDDFVASVNARRWRFLERGLKTFVEPLLSGVADALRSYYMRRPYARPSVGLFRLCESVDATFLIIEIDERTAPSMRESAERYVVQ